MNMVKSNNRIVLITIVVFLFPVFLFAQEPGNLGRFRVFEPGRAVAITSDDELVVVSLRVRWFVYDRRRFLANFPSIGTTELYIGEFTRSVFRDFVKNYTLEELRNSRLGWPDRDERDQRDELADGFVDRLNTQDDILWSGGIKIDAVEMTIRSPMN